MSRCVRSSSGARLGLWWWGSRFDGQPVDFGDPVVGPVGGFGFELLVGLRLILVRGTEHALQVVEVHAVPGVAAQLDVERAHRDAQFLGARAVRFNGWSLGPYRHGLAAEVEQSIAAPVEDDAPSEPGWDDLPHDEDDFVAFQDLEHHLVHNPSLLSRRLRKLAETKPPLVEIAGPKAGSGLHFNALRVRITAEGTRRIKPDWERYARMSANLLQGIPQGRLEAHCQVNEEISRRIRARREAAKDFSVDA